MVANSRQSADEYLNVGLYSAAQASQYARISPRLVKSWTSSVISRFTPHDDSSLFSFIDLLQLMSVRSFRTSADKSLQVSLQKIRRTVQIAEQEYSITYPLARQHQAYAYAGNLYLLINEGTTDEALIGATGPFREHHMMRPILEPYMRRVRFDNETGLGNQYTAKSNSEYSIVIDPSVRFGEPYVDPIGVTTRALVEAVAAEGSVEAAADMFDVPFEAVWLAVEYHDETARPAA